MKMNQRHIQIYIRTLGKLQSTRYIAFQGMLYFRTADDWADSAISADAFQNACRQILTNHLYDTGTAAMNALLPALEAMSEQAGMSCLDVEWYPQMLVNGKAVDAGSESCGFRQILGVTSRLIDMQAQTPETAGMP